ncbi:MAG: hypothetical protein CFE46_15195 [Burkholderiales bacterium PBB6]|nr:MAG: hypothetical protein CFE46_15195 [Burkholderiales bacterium PBB6]
MDLILVRHTRVALPAGTCYGQLDVPLQQPAEPSFEQVQAGVAQVLAHVLPGLPDGQRVAPDRLLCSPLRRAAVLADALGATWALAAQADARWMELNFGEWEGRPWEDIPRAQSDPWAADFYRLAPPGGETYAALCARVAAAMDEQAAAGGCAVVVCHAGPMRVAAARGMGLPMSQWPEVELPMGGCLHLRTAPDHSWQLMSTAEQA